MRITKHEHACLRLERDGHTLLIDPGSFTLPLIDLHDVVAIVLTHEHADHWSSEHLQRLRGQFPDVPIYGPSGVAHAASEFSVIAVSAGDSHSVESFTLEFFGGDHAVIHESIPNVDNVGVLVNGEFYYAGDAYTVPTGVDVRVLAAPAGAPWLKIGDAMDYVVDVAPRRCFATHDMTLSRAGLGMSHARLKWATEQGGGEFVALEPGESIDM